MSLFVSKNTRKSVWGTVCALTEKLNKVSCVEEVDGGRYDDGDRNAGSESAILVPAVP